MRRLQLTDDPEITRELAVEVLAQFLGQPSVPLRIEFGGSITHGFGFSAWDKAQHCYLIRLKTDCCTWHQLAHEMAHCLNDIEPGLTYDLQTDPHDKIREITDVDPGRGQRLKIEHVQSELRADYCAAYILTELRELAGSRGYDLCD